MPTSTGQTQWSPINENIENDEARQKDIAYDALKEQSLNLEGAAEALGGIGAISPEDGEEIAASAIAEEQAEREDPEDELFAKLEGIEDGEDGILKQGDDALGGSMLTDTLDSTETIEQQRILQEGIYSPRIDSFAKNEDITGQEAQVIKKVLLSQNIDDINSIPDSIVTEEKKSFVIKSLNDSQQPENMEKYSENFSKDFGSELSNFQNEKGEFETDTAKTANEMIANRYMTSLEGEVLPKEKRIALNAAFASALNVEIDGKNFKRKEAFKQISNDIRDESLPIEKRFEAFTDLLSFTSLEQGKGGKQQDVIYRKGIAERKLSDIGRIDKFTELLTLFRKQAENSPKAIEVAQELEALRIEADISSGDANLLAGGKIDKISDTLTQNPTESA